MHFSRLALNYFRNYENLQLELPDGIACFTGNNGEGKTNLLEALHYLSMTRGFQGQKEKYALKNGERYFMVSGEMENERRMEIQCNYVAGKGKKMLVNGKALSRMSDHVGKIPVVVVLPNDTQLIYGTPGLRRKFMDSFISQYDPEYLKQLIRYDKVLNQRNALLKLFFEQQRFDVDELELWDSQLIPAGQYLFGARKLFLNRFRPVFADFFRKIVSEKEVPHLDLDTQFTENTAEEWKELLHTHRQKDRFSQRSSIGTHKDDLVFRIDEQPVKNYGSQGQQKTFLIALKFAQYQLLEKESGKSPVLLLDDIFDKLDVHRLGAIAGLLDEMEGQVFVTDTTLERTKKVFGNIRRRSVVFYAVGDGKVAPIKESHE